MSILNSAIKTNSQQKLNILSNLFIDGTKKQINFELDIHSVLINFINELTENHILVFKYLIDALSEVKEVNSYEELFTHFKGRFISSKIDRYEFKMYLKDLENKTLLIFSTDIRDYGSSGGFIVLENYVKSQSIVITSIGEKFTLMLENTPNG